MTSRIVRVTAVVGLILLIPLFGNIYVDGWNWGPLDFVMMGALLCVVGMTIDLAARKIVDPTQKILVIVGVILAFVALWVEMAVDGVSQLLAHIF